MKRKEINWSIVQAEHDKGVFIRDLMQTFSLSRTSIETAVKYGLFVKKVIPRKFTEEQKLKHSEKRKKFLKDNPDKHPWKSKNKFKSVPCEKIKNILLTKGVKFVEEYSPLEKRFFSLDISFPEKKIGIEINGQQHYEPDGSLKKYYQERHELLESNGWKIYEIHYSLVFNSELINSMIDSILGSEKKVEFDYSTYVKKEKVCYFCNKCGFKLYSKSMSGLCSKCSNQSRRKVKRPSREELEILIRTRSFTAISKMFGVSDNAIRKWAKYYDLPITLKEKRCKIQFNSF
jgi:very-short-patch-repair endonuclease